MRFCLRKYGRYSIRSSSDCSALIISNYQDGNTIARFKYEDRVGLRLPRFIGFDITLKNHLTILDMDYTLGIRVFECAYFDSTIQIIYLDLTNKAYIVDDAISLLQVFRSLRIKDKMTITQSTRWETVEDHWEFKKTSKRHKGFLNGVDMGTKTLENWQKYILTKYNPLEKL